MARLCGVLAAGAETVAALCEAADRAGLRPIVVDPDLVFGDAASPRLERFGWYDLVLVEDRFTSGPWATHLSRREASRPGRTVPVVDPEDDDAIDRAMRAALSARSVPLIDVIGDWQRLSHEKTDLFRELVRVPPDAAAALAAARGTGDVGAVRAVEASLAPLDDADNAALVDLLLSYRGVGASTELVGLVERLPEELAAQPMVREQYAFGLNRIGRGEDAESVLADLIAERGDEPESCSILGRVYKDRAAAAGAAGDAIGAATWRDAAIDAYRRGFEADWRDTYPGVNLLNLLVERDPADPEIAVVGPVVTYSARRQLATRPGDYWGEATMLEIAALADDPATAEALLPVLLANPVAHEERWMFTTTAGTLARQLAIRPWLAPLEASLRAAGAD